MKDTVVLLGAARSGTKVLRDVLGGAKDLSVVPFDINYVWRAGNESLPHDELPEDSADQAAPFIRSQIQRMADGDARVVEKTVSNPLRIPFVRRVLPNAQYIWLFRDGRDVTESAMRSWTTPSAARDLWPKLVGFPVRENPQYLGKYLSRIVRQRLSRTHTSSWGPAYRGMAQDVASLPLAHVCAQQWARTVQAYLDHRHLLPPNTVEVRYEDLVENPAARLTELAEQLEVRDVDGVVTAASRITTANVGKHQGSGLGEQKEVMAILRPQLQALGYLADS
ncbi:sulfotransferase family protein [Euzebya tangerina]|uniref:sulfotransferase family protein n=1 Tax=Euzebya tangerina TaxID=591198 RepID=UPI0013C2CDEE|nr:sulfotransferase [Euzebya tangerina]